VINHELTVTIGKRFGAGFGVARSQTHHRQLVDQSIGKTHHDLSAEQRESDAIPQGSDPILCY
jgi:hypothetical protein